MNADKFPPRGSLKNLDEFGTAHDESHVVCPILSFRSIWAGIIYPEKVANNRICSGGCESKCKFKRHFEDLFCQRSVDKMMPKTKTQQVDGCKNPCAPQEQAEAWFAAWPRVRLA